MRPNPQPRTTDLVRRDLYCQRAMLCLDVADQRRWPGVDCSQCPLAGREQEPEAASVVPPLYVYDAGEVVPDEPERAPRKRSGYPAQVKCAAALAAASAPLSPVEIARRSGTPVKTVYAALGDLIDAGTAERVKLGRYRLTKDAELPAPLPPTQRDRICEYIGSRKGEVTVEDVHAAFATANPQILTTELAKLARQGRIRRLRFGVYGRVA